jgi:hypothetical protein
MVPETSVIFKRLARLRARENGSDFNRRESCRSYAWDSQECHDVHPESEEAGQTKISVKHSHTQT